MARLAVRRLYDADLVKSDKAIEDEKIKALLATSASRKGKAKRKTKKADADEAGGADEAGASEE